MDASACVANGAPVAPIPTLIAKAEPGSEAGDNDERGSSQYRVEIAFDQEFTKKLGKGDCLTGNGHCTVLKADYFMDRKASLPSALAQRWEKIVET